jgi:hypothetical protein
VERVGELGRARVGDATGAQLEQRWHQMAWCRKATGGVAGRVARLICAQEWWGVVERLAQSEHHGTV